MFISCAGLMAFCVRQETFTSNRGSHCLWRLFAPDHEHGDKKSHNQPHALQRCLALGDFMVLIEHLIPLADDSTYQNLHRNDIRVFDKQSWTTAARVLDEENVRQLERLDDEAEARGDERERTGTIAYLQFMGDLMCATGRTVLSVARRLDLAFGAAFFMIYWRIFISITVGYTMDVNFVSDPSYHDLLLRVGSLVCGLVAQALSYPDFPWTPWQHGEHWLERLFGQARAGHGSANTFTMSELSERQQRGSYRNTAQLTSGLKTHNRRHKRLDAEGRTGVDAVPTLREALGGDVSEAALQRLISSSSITAFVRVRAMLHRLGMADALIAAGRTELNLSAPPQAFELTLFAGV